MLYNSGASSLLGMLYDSCLLTMPCHQLVNGDTLRQQALQRMARRS